MGVAEADFAAQVWEHSTSGICAVDADGSLVMINAAARRTLGGACATAPLGTPCEQALADYPTLARLLREALAGRPALSRSDFLAVMRRSPDVAMAVVQELARRLRSTDQHASSLSFQRVKERTQGLLQRLAKDECGRSGHRITPVVTHQQIADMVGTSRETVTRALKGLKQEGWLSQEGKRYVVPV